MPAAAVRAVQFVARLEWVLDIWTSSLPVRTGIRRVTAWRYGVSLCPTIPPAVAKAVGDEERHKDGADERRNAQRFKHELLFRGVRAHAVPSLWPSMRARRLRASAKTSSSARMMACSCSIDSSSGGGALIAGRG